MRKNSARRTVVAALTLGLLAGSVSLVAATADEIPEPTYAVNFSSPTVATGETVDVTVTASDVPDLYAYDVDLEFDPRMFVYMPGSAESGTSGVTVDSRTQGVLRLVHTKLGTSPAASGDVVLATMTLRAVGGTGPTTVDAASLISVATDLTTVEAADVASGDITVTRRRG